MGSRGRRMKDKVAQMERMANFLAKRPNYEDTKRAEKYLGYGNGGDTDKWLGGLSESNKMDVNVYTGYSYKDVNKAMREHDTKSDYWELGQSIKKSLSQATLSKGIVVHRGDDGAMFNFKPTSTPEEMVASLRGKSGKTFTIDNFLSTSTTDPFTGQVQYHINVPKGKGRGAYIKKMSNYPTENEFLLNSSTKYRLDRAVKARDDEKLTKIHVYLTVVD